MVLSAVVWRGLVWFGLFFSLFFFFFWFDFFPLFFSSFGLVFYSFFFFFWRGRDVICGRVGFRTRWSGVDGYFFIMAFLRYFGEFRKKRGGKKEKRGGGKESAGSR